MKKPCGDRVNSMQKYLTNTQVTAKQPSVIITQQQDILDAAKLYLNAGLILVPLTFASKNPVPIGWNKRTNTHHQPRPD
jgi:hypothetical protein